MLVTLRQSDVAVTRRKHVEMRGDASLKANAPQITRCGRNTRRFISYQLVIARRNSPHRAISRKHKECFPLEESIPLSFAEIIDLDLVGAEEREISAIVDHPVGI